MEENILEVEALVKRYDRFTLGPVSFSIPRGYIMGFVGQNGAGKSTTIKCIMNLTDFEAGNIRIFGLDSRRDCLTVRNRIGYVSEDQYFYEDMTVEWTSSFVAGFYPEWDWQYFNSLTKKFELDGRKKIKELSKGMKVKLSLAQAMAHRPELLILDEPTSGLDPVVRADLLEVFMDIIQDERCSIFFSSHITSDIERVADYVTVIDHGKLVLSRDKNSLLENYKVVKADNRYCAPEICDCMTGIKRNDMGFSGLVQDIRRFEGKFRQVFPQGSFKSEKVNLDEILVRVARKGENA